MPKKLSLKQFAYQTIKDKILNCVYMPNSFLNEDLLCEELNISRTPVRDALSRLEQEHLIRILPKKGFLVAPLSAKEINMVYEGRILLETYILSTYCQELPDTVLDHLYDLQEKYYQNIVNQLEDVTLIDNDFHATLTNQCTNRYFLHIIQEIENQSCRLRVLSGRISDKRLFASYNEHQLLLEHLRSNRMPEAVEAMKVHLLNSKEAAFHVFIHGAISL
ncbi:MAG: GntR family transcriptional regulator [Lachnospiraceae bacterium]|nr:GntR family transcriptional regulator [Lachnospiraceae bacterium]